VALQFMGALEASHRLSLGSESRNAQASQASIW
jgi:hypothetical protein